MAREKSCVYLILWLMLLYISLYEHSSVEDGSTSYEVVKVQDGFQ